VLHQTRRLVFLAASGDRPGIEVLLPDELGFHVAFLTASILLCALIYDVYEA
jgi:hypothetical protein